MNTAPLRGHIVIYVDGYKVRHKNTFHIISTGDGTFSVPDTMMPPPRYEVDSVQWWTTGWAVGANERGRLCSRVGPKPLLKFYSFDDAVSYAWRRQQKHKGEQHTLVYVIEKVKRGRNSWVIRSQEDIAAIHAELDAEAKQAAIIEAKRAEGFQATYPSLDDLQDRFGRSRGRTLSALLGEIRSQGLEAAKRACLEGSSYSGCSKSTWYRSLSDLRATGLID